MITRRSLLVQSAFATAAFATAGGARAAQDDATQGPLGRAIGLQLYTVREQAAADLAGTLATLARIGYREVELAGLHELPAAAFAAELAASGLDAPAAHYSMFALQSGLEQILDDLHRLGVRHLVCSFPGAPEPARLGSDAGTVGAAIFRGGLSLDDWRWNADELNRIGAAAAEAGLAFAYHNHAMEFARYDGTVAFDELIGRTDPRLVAFEVDCAWVHEGDRDPADFIARLGSRVALLHIKDVPAKAEGSGFATTEVGNGVIDWRAVFAAADPQSLAHYFVEQEHFERPPLEAVARSFDYLHALASAEAAHA